MSMSNTTKRVKEIRRKTRRKFSSEEKIRIVLDGLRGESSIAELCRQECINSNLYYRWSKDSLEAGEKRLSGDTVREANNDEVVIVWKQCVSVVKRTISAHVLYVKLKPCVHNRSVVMNRKNLTTAVLAGLAGAAGIVGTAQAVNINADGFGQVLVFPYYTTNNGNSTFFSIVNTRNIGKAIKIRFLEGMNSIEVLDFNLYMSPYDVWAAQVYDDAGTPSVVVPDKSCTVPYIYSFPGSKQAFLTYALTDGGPTTLARTTEGHFEAIEMGDLTAATKSAVSATHVNGTPPAQDNPAIAGTSLEVCGALIGAWSTSATGVAGYWADGSYTEDLATPSGGLFGGAGVVNVAQGSLYTYDALAFNDWTRSLWSDGPVTQLTPIHQPPGNAQPSLGAGDRTNAEVPWSRSTSALALRTPSGMWTPFTRAIDAVSFTLQRATVMNEYTTQAALLGKTEWVVTFPTKNFYVYPAVSGSATVRRPFSSLWSATTDNSCDAVTLTIWDREEQVQEGTAVGPIVSPPPPDPTATVVQLCYETNVVQFDSSVAPATTATSLLGSSRGISVDNLALGATFDQGWMRMNFGATAADNLGGLLGRPVTGFRVSEFTNTAAAAGIKATYGGLWQHKYTRLCSAYNDCTGTP